MFIVAAKAVAEQVTADDLATGLIYPPQSHILDASLHVAARIAEYIFDQGLAAVPRPTTSTRTCAGRRLPTRLSIGRIGNRRAMDAAASHARMPPWAPQSAAILPAASPRRARQNFFTVPGDFNLVLLDQFSRSPGSG